MNRAALATQLLADEGKCLIATKDSRDNRIVGVNHLVTWHDHVGADGHITEERCQEFFDQDIDTAIEACQRIFKDFDSLPEVAQDVMANMAFNMGEKRLKLFGHLIDAVSKKQWRRVAVEMRSSAWWYQVGFRASRLEDLIMTLVLPLE